MSYRPPPPSTVSASAGSVRAKLSSCPRSRACSCSAKKLRASAAVYGVVCGHEKR